MMNLENQESKDMKTIKEIIKTDQEVNLMKARAEVTTIGKNTITNFDKVMS